MDVMTRALVDDVRLHGDRVRQAIQLGVQPASIIKQTSLNVPLQQVKKKKRRREALHIRNRLSFVVLRPKRCSSCVAMITLCYPVDRI